MHPANQDSDIDIVVKLKNNVGMKLYSLYDDFENNFNKLVDVLTENEIMKKYNIDINELIKIYPFNEEEFAKNVGGHIR